MQTLDVVIGLVIYFLFMSLVASALVEMISSWRRKRGQMLRAAVNAATNGGEDFTNALYFHPLVYSLFEADKVGAGVKKSMPSYMSSEIFARAYVETVIAMPLAEVGDLGMVFSAESRIWPDPREVPDPAPGAKALAPIASSKGKITMRKSDLENAYRALRPHVIAAGGDRDRTLRCVAEHFDRVNERINGRYRRWVSYWLFWIGFALAIATNGDSTRLVNRLVNNPDLRNQLVQSAGLDLDAADLSREETIDRIRVIEGITGGWGTDPILAPGGLGPGSFTLKALGFLVTAFAVSLGAPFWYDLLGKLVKLRKMLMGKEDDSSGDKPMPKPTTVSELGANLAALNSGEPLHGLLLPPESISQLGVLARQAQQCYAAPAEFEAFVRDQMGQDATVTYIDRRAMVTFDDPAPEVTADLVRIPVDSQIYVIRTKNQVVVACRGTEPKVLHDIATDVRFKPAKVSWANETKEALAHRGFLTALEVVWPDLEKALKGEGDGTQMPVYFTGHSLGGALAVLAAARFLALDEGAVNRFGGLHTFGQPRVGNAAFAEWATLRFRGRYTRAINHRDIVPQLPPPQVGTWEFKHFGIAHVFDSAGRLAINPGWFFRLADYALPDEELRAMFKQPVQNHDSYRYASLYAALAKPAAPAA